MVFEVLGEILGHGRSGFIFLEIAMCSKQYTHQPIYVNYMMVMVEGQVSLHKP